MDSLPSPPTTPTAQVKITFHTAKDLEADPRLNRQLIDVINVAYSSYETFRSDKLRFTEQNGLWDTIGADGICAVAWVKNAIGGTASLIPWRPQRGGMVDEALRTERPGDYVLAEEGLSYEIKAISTAPEAKAARAGGDIG